jgi:hypothetical protein
MLKERKCFVAITRDFCSASWECLPLALTFNIHRRYSSNKSCLESTSSHSHAKEGWTKRNSTTRPRRCTAPHRRDLPHRKPIPKRPVSTTTTSVSTPTLFFYTIPESWSTLCVTGTLFSLLDSVPVLSRSFSPTLAPIPFTATRTTGSSFSPSGISPLLLAPHQCHHTTSQAARSSRKIKRQPNERAFLRRVCVLLVIWDFSLSGHSVSVTPRKTPDTRRLKRILATRKHDKRFLAAIAT